MRKYIIAITVLLIICFAPVYPQTARRPQIANERLNQFVNIRDYCVSNTGDEVFFTIQSPFEEISRIGFMKQLKGSWTDPQLMAFSGNYSDLEPFLSPDQLRLYFVSNRPLVMSADSSKDFDIWYVERDNPEAKWSYPVNMGSPVNSPYDEFYPSIALNGNLYLTIDRPGGMGKDDIYICESKDNRYLSPVLLDTNINSTGYEFNAFISREESFIIFSKYNASDGHGSGDLYISYKQNGVWTPAENMGAKINTKYMEYCPFYDENSKTLYFTSKRNTLVNKNFVDVNELKQYIMQNENGLSKVYKMKYDIR